MSDVGAVVPAAGVGARFGGETPKSLVSVAGRPLVAHALRALNSAPSIGWIVVAAQAGQQADIERLARSSGVTKLHRVVVGGATRAESVARGIEALPSEAALVLVHDGARPCVTVEVIESTIAQARRDGAAASGLPAWLTVKAVDAQDLARLTLDRDRLWFVHTPQVGRRAWFADAIGRLRAQASAGRDPFAQFSDDVSMLEWAGYPVRMVAGDPWNLKVTTPEDVVLVEAILAARAASAPAVERRSPKRVARMR